MSQSESYGYLIVRITGSFLDRCLGTLDCSRALLTRNSRGPSRTVLDFGLKGRIPTFCLVLWLVPLLSISPSRTVDSVRDILYPLESGSFVIKSRAIVSKGLARELVVMGKRGGFGFVGLFLRD